MATLPVYGLYTWLISVMKIVLGFLERTATGKARPLTFCFRKETKGLGRVFGSS